MLFKVFLNTYCKIFWYKFSYKIWIQISFFHWYIKIPQQNMYQLKFTCVKSDEWPWNPLFPLLLSWCFITFFLWYSAHTSFSEACVACNLECSVCFLYLFHFFYSCGCFLYLNLLSISGWVFLYVIFLVFFIIVIVIVSKYLKIKEISYGFENIFKHRRMLPYHKYTERNSCELELN